MTTSIERFICLLRRGASVGIYDTSDGTFITNTLRLGVRAPLVDDIERHSLTAYASQFPDLLDGEHYRKMSTEEAREVFSKHKPRKQRYTAKPKAVHPI